MRALITVLAILQIILAVAGIAPRKSGATLPKWYFWALALVAVAMVVSVAYQQLS